MPDRATFKGAGQVVPFPVEASFRAGPAVDLADGGEPPHDGGMEARFAKLEGIIPTLATKADVEKASHDVTKWVVGTMVAGVGLFIVIMTFVLNNAIPQTQAAVAPSPAPIIIQVPASPAPALPPAN